MVGAHVPSRRKDGGDGAALVSGVEELTAANRTACIAGKGFTEGPALYHLLRNLLRCGLRFDTLSRLPAPPAREKAEPTDGHIMYALNVHVSPTFVVLLAGGWLRVARGGLTMTGGGVTVPAAWQHPLQLLLPRPTCGNRPMDQPGVPGRPCARMQPEPGSGGSLERPMHHWGLTFQAHWPSCSEQRAHGRKWMRPRQDTYSEAHHSTN